MGQCDMIILGIDPGYAIVGWGVLEYKMNKFRVLGYGAITTEAHTDFPLRLQTIYNYSKWCLFYQVRRKKWIMMNLSLMKQA